MYVCFGCKIYPHKTHLLQLRKIRELKVIIYCLAWSVRTQLTFEYNSLWNKMIQMWKAWGRNRRRKHLIVFIYCHFLVQEQGRIPVNNEGKRWRKSENASREGVYDIVVILRIPMCNCSSHTDQVCKQLGVRTVCRAFRWTYSIIITDSMSQTIRARISTDSV